MFDIFKKIYYKLLGKDYRIYSNELIKHLEYEHGILFDLYKQLISVYEKKDTKQILNLLDKIEQKYKFHVELEDKKLYTYLKIVYKDYPEIIQWIDNKQKEMGEITTVFLNYYKKYKNKNYLEKHFDDGLNELKQIGIALTSRVEMEQNKLYKLYVQKEKLSEKDIQNLLSK